MKILISDKTSSKCAEILRNAGHQVEEKSGISPEELIAIIGDYDALIVRGMTKVTTEVIEHGKNLKIIGRAGTGVDNIDVATAEKKRIVVMNTPGANTNAVAELALSFMLILSRDLRTALGSLKNGRWEKKKFEGTEILGKTLGIIGYNRVGRKLGAKCVALGMKVICYDPKLKKNLIDQDGIEIYATMENVLKAANYISIHLTKKAETVNFIGKPEFELMKRGVFFINCSRGGIVNEKDLLWALNEGIVSRAALDVYEVEPPTDFDLIQHPNVFCTPHIGAATVESQENVGILIAEQVVDYFAGKGIRNAVTKFQ